MHLIRGRDVDAEDLETRRPVAVINETMATRYFGARDPVGSAVTVERVPHTVVGIVRDFQSRDVCGTARREMYVVFDDPNTGDAGQAQLAVRVRGNASRSVGSIRRAVEDVEATMFFRIVTLVLVALGLYGVTSYSTSQRTSEFGLRAALGAESL
ncbi:MAG: ABC transporter permease [Gemmatimonadales bacterium]